MWFTRWSSRGHRPPESASRERPPPIARFRFACARKFPALGPPGMPPRKPLARTPRPSAGLQELHGRASIVDDLRIYGFVFAVKSAEALSLHGCILKDTIDARPADLELPRYFGCPHAALKQRQHFVSLCARRRSAALVFGVIAESSRKSTLSGIENLGGDFVGA